MKKKLYLSGKITGDNDYQVKFQCAENKLFDAGYYPVNPAAVVVKGTPWEEAMRRALVHMLQCDGVAVLFDWRRSRGARIEVRLARAVGITVKPLEQWIHGTG
jgi:hypothetical protein